MKKSLSLLATTRTVIGGLMWRDGVSLAVPVGRMALGPQQVWGQIGVFGVGDWVCKVHSRIGKFDQYVHVADATVETEHQSLK